MGIKIKHGKPSTIISAAKKAGKAVATQRAAEQGARIAEQAMANAARLQEKQMEIEYRQTLKQQDMAIDLQMQERAKLWEIDKMQIRSQVDFQREEQQRQRRLDSADNAIQQIDKEILAGRMTEQEAYPIKQKLELSKLGVNVPTSAFPTGAEEDRYGVDPYWMRWREAPEGTPERQLYEAKMEQQISGVRTGTVPYYLDPQFISTYPEAARQSQEARGIFLSDEEFSNLAGVGAETLPEATVAGAEGERVRVVSPNGDTGSILRGEITEYRAAGFEILDEDTPTTKPVEGIEPVEEDIVKQLEAGEAKFYKPSLRTFATMSPLRALMERWKAKKIVR